MAKTNKSYTKRLRVTKNGKILARRPGQNHFNAKESGKESLLKKRPTSLNLPKKARQQFIPRKHK
ncbi:MAG: 50S ribosomal protein L35 [Candidatus Paceibacterota bacterium]